MSSSENFGAALAAYALFFLFLTIPFWALDQTISPYRRFQELGIPDNTGSQLVENRKFSDFTNAYIPEIHEHLKSRDTGQRLWASGNELGRPLYHTAGFSPVYLPSWMISRMTDNPFRFITVLSLSYCFLTGLFVILLCRDKGIGPVAALIAGTSIMGSPFVMYWLTFPMFLAVFCWTAGALWASHRIAKNRDAVGWSVLAFSIYSLLMTGYPQSVVFHCYILAGFGCYLSWRVQQRGWLELSEFLALCSSAVAVGLILALPVYLDLLYLASESGRVSPDPSFFTVHLPKFDTFLEIIRFIALTSFPELFGNPVDATYPFKYDGISVTPIVVFFGVFCVLTQFRKTCGWWLPIALTCLITFFPSAYEFGVKYLGFNLSRGNPLGLITLPLAFIVAYGVDALVKQSRAAKFSFMIAMGIVLALLVIALGFGLAQAVPIRWESLLILLAVIILLGVQYQKTRPDLLVGSLVIMLAMVSPLILRQDPAQIATTSPLVEKVRAHVPAGSRFAVADSEIQVLPPNLNAELGIASVHSYNSLSSRRYHDLIKALGGETQTFGRWNGIVSPDYSSTSFWMSNISLMLSAKKLSHGNLEYLGNESGVHMHKVTARMGDSIQVLGSPLSATGPDGLQLGDPRLFLHHAPLKRVDTDELLEFEVLSGLPSLLVLSQKYHRDWEAWIFNGSAWVDASVVAVNGVFLGVPLPNEAERVRLEFRPAARFAWMAKIFWILLLVFVPIWTLLQARRRPGRFRGNKAETPATG